MNKIANLLLLNVGLNQRLNIAKLFVVFDPFRGDKYDRGFSYCSSLCFSVCKSNHNLASISIYRVTHKEWDLKDDCAEFIYSPFSCI